MERDKILDDGFFNFIREAIYRTRNIQRYNTRSFIKPQNVLEHHGSVALIAMVLSDKLNKMGIKNNTERVLRMAITHDLDEIVSGDVNFGAKYQYGEKSENIRNALHELSDHVIFQLYNNLGELRSDYLSLYDEEKEKKTVESLIVKLADYIDVELYSDFEKSLGNTLISEEHKNALMNEEKIIRKISEKAGDNSV